MVLKKTWEKTGVTLNEYNQTDKVNCMLRLAIGKEETPPVYSILESGRQKKNGLT